MASHLSAQDNSIKFRNIAIENGLSQSSVNAILQDNQGFIWIGTQDGLNMYDGHAISVFKHNQNDPQSIGNNFITSLLKDKSGKIWIGTTGGLDLLDPRTTVFQHYQHNSKNEFSISSNNISAIAEDLDGYIWVGTKDKGLNRIDLKTNKAYIFKSTDSELTGNHINDLYVDDNGLVWVATTRGITVFDGESAIYSFVYDHNKDDGLTDHNVQCITQGDDGAYWIGTTAGIDKLTLTSSGESFTHFAIQDTARKQNLSIAKIYVDGPASAWIATTSNGLYRYFEDASGSEKFYKHTNIHYERSSLISNTIYCIYPDIAGNIWIGTKNGLSRFDALKQGFVHLKRTYDTENTLPSNTIWCIYPETNDVFWIGTQEGLSRYDRLNNSFINYAFSATNLNRKNSWDVFSFFKDRQGNYWMGTADGLFKTEFSNNYAEAKRTYVPYRDSTQEDLDIVVYRITEDVKNNRLLVGTSEGFSCIDLTTSDYTFFEHEPSNQKSLSGTNVRGVLLDHNNVIWLGTQGGLSKMHEDNGAVWFENYQYISGKNSLSSDMIVTLYEDKNHNIWIGTNGGGLNKLDAKTSKFSVYTNASHNLTNDAVYGILEDETQQLWLSTNNGLSRFDPIKEKSTNYDRKDGIQSNEFNSGAYAKTGSNEMIFGGINGLSFFRPDNIGINTIPPQVAITGILINGKPIKSEELLKNEIHLSHKDASFTIKFAALHYTNPENNKFKYILAGADKDYVITSSEYRAHYANIPPGEYTFKVFAANSDGVWTDVPATVKITIAAPYWKRTWFQVLMISIALLLVYAIYWMRVRDIRKQKARLSSLVEQKTQEVIRQKNELEEQSKLLQKEKDKAEELLRNILPEETAEELKSKGKASARQYRRVSIMFTDFQGFTRIAEKLKPTELVERLDSYFIKFDEIIEKNNLEKIKTIGDAYMCAGGVPVRNKENPIHTVLAALEIQRYMVSRKEIDKANGDESWKLRIGINTGETIAGVIGTKRFAYDIWGNAVNIASRLEAASETGKVNISGRTYDLIEPYFDCTYRGKIPAKNKGDIDMYYVNRIKPELSVNGLGNDPNQAFWDYVNLHLFSAINYMKAERYIMRLLEKKLSPDLHYHSIWHTKDVTESAERIALLEGVKGEDLFLLQTAATYHDAGFVEQYDNNEPVGARMAEEILPKYGYTTEQIVMISSLIHATKIPHAPENHLEQIICDADLDYLGREDFHEIADKLRLELREHGKINSDRLWDEIQIKFLTQHQYFTQSAITTRQPGKEKHVAEIKARLLRDEYVD